MKFQKFPSFFCYLFISSFLIIAGCSKPNLKIPESLPPIIKSYKHVKIKGHIPWMKNTGVYLSKGDVYSLFGTGKIQIWPGGKLSAHSLTPGRQTIGRIGKNPYFVLSGFWLWSGNLLEAGESGNLYLGILDGLRNRYGVALKPGHFSNNTGSFSVDVIVWEREDWIQIAAFYARMKRKDPANVLIADAFKNAKKRKELYLAELKASKELEETKKEMKR